MSTDQALALQPQLYCGRDLDTVEFSRFAGGLAAVITERCPAKPTGNEDAAALIPFDDRSGLLAVADGVGGGRGGQLAASTALEALQQAVDEAARDGLSLRTAVLDGIEEANRRVQQLGVGAATTLAVLEIQSTTVRPYHVGDSMILVVGQRGRSKLQTVSHSPVGFAVEAGWLDEAEAMHHEDRHLVSNVVGTADMRIEIGPAVSLAPRDTVLLASDGLFDNLHVAETIERLRKGPLPDAVQALADEARHRMTHPDDEGPSKPDDLTLVAWRPNLRGN